MQDMNVSSDPQVLKRRLRTRMAALREMMGPAARARADALLAEQACAHPAYLKADVVFTYLSTGNEVDTRAIIRDAWKRGKTVVIPRCVPEKRAMQWYRIDDFEGLEKGSYGIEEPPADPARRVEVPVREVAAGEDGVAVPPAPSAQTTQAAQTTQLAQPAQTTQVGQPVQPAQAAQAAQTAQAAPSAQTTQAAQAAQVASSAQAGLANQPAQPVPSAQAVRAVAFVPGYTFDRQGFRVGYGGGYYDVFLAAFAGISIGLCRAEQRSDEPIPCTENDIPVTCVLFA